MRSDHKALSTVQDLARPRRLQGRHRLYRHQQGDRHRQRHQGQARRRQRRQRCRQGQDPGRDQGAAGPAEELRRRRDLLRRQLLSVTSDKTAAGARRRHRRRRPAGRQDRRFVQPLGHSARSRSARSTSRSKASSSSTTVRALRSRTTAFSIVRPRSGARLQRRPLTTPPTRLPSQAVAPTPPHTRLPEQQPTTADAAATAITGVSVYNLDITASGVTDNFITSMIAKVERRSGSR